MNVKSFSLFAAATMIGAVPVFAGPPLLTDDPETPGPNHWEINVAMTVENRDHDWEWESPLLDINYGVGERIQLKYEVPWLITDADGHGARGDFGNSLAGVKWRFLDQETAGVDVSTYPQIEFNTSGSSVRRDLVEDGMSYLLPFEISRKFGALTIYGEWGYAWKEHHDDEWFYGIAADYELTQTFSIMGELHGEADSSFRDHELVVNLGLHWEWTQNVSLIASAGRSVHSNADGRVDLLSYVGLQLTF